MWAAWHFSLFSQPLGSWKLYFPYKDATGLEDAGTFVYVGSTQSLYSYDKTSGLITFYDKSTVLSDVGIKCMDYHPSTKTLAIAYNNSNIDLLVNETEVFNIPDLKNKSVVGTKTINGICNAGDRIYFASDLGVVVVNQRRKEISATYVIGTNGENTTVWDVAVGNQQIFAATEQGMKSAPLTASNLQDFRNWTHYSAAHSLPEKKFQFTEYAAGKFYAVCSDTLFRFDGNSWTKVAFDTALKVVALDSKNNTLFLMCHHRISGQGNVLKIDENGNQQLITNVVGIPIQYFEDDYGNVWKADLYNGVFKNDENINPNSPWSFNSFCVAIQNNITWISGGGTDASWGYTYNTSGMYVLENNQWRNFNEYSWPPLANFPDIVNIAVSRDGKKAWLASNREGLAVIDLAANTIQSFNKNNSPLQAAVGDPVATRVTAVALDKNDHLWMINSYTNFGMIVRKSNGDWLKLPFLNSGQLVKKLLITSNGYKWMLMRPGSIAVYYEGNQLDNMADDVFKTLGTGKGNGGLNNANVNCIVEDKEGAVWVGTDEGIEIFYCARNVLSQSGCDAQRIIVQRDGFNAYLFSSEVVKALAVDAANRKWVGTNNGVWLISADGKEELLRFNVDNSPLPSNFITDIAINHQTGEVIFATEQGIAVYLGDAVKGGETCNQATVFPNPIPADYSGPIAVKGLVDDAYVKITDASGWLVHQGKANGGQMIWNARTYHGNRVASGVYTVYSANELGKERCVAKIIIMN
jgi:hypothetical protein